MTRFWLITSLLFGLTCATAQSDVASLKSMLAEVTGDTARIDLLHKLAYRTLKGNVAESGSYARQAMDLSRQLNDPHRLAASYISLGNYHARSGTLDKDQVDSMYLAALEIALELRDSQLLIVIYNDLGIQANNGGDRVRAIELYQKSLTFDPDTQDLSHYTMALRNIGIVHDHNNQYDLAETYFRNAISIAAKANDTFEIAEATNSLGITTSKRGELRAGLSMFKKAAKMYASQDRPETLLNALNNIIISYQVMGHPDSATIYLNDVLTRAMESGNHRLQMRVLQAMGNQMENQGSLDSALVYFQRGLSLASQNADPYHEQNLYKDIARIFQKKGDLKNALAFTGRYHAFKDSIVSAESLLRINDLEVLYQTARKDQQLQKQELQLAKQKNQRKFFFGIIGLLCAAALGTFLILRERLRVRNKITSQEKLIQAQKIAALQNENKFISMSSMIKGQEEERSRVAQDLHDGLGGLMATIKSHFESVTSSVGTVPHSTTPGAESKNGNGNLKRKTASLIDQACTEVSRISHNLMPKALAEHGLTEAVTDLAVSLREAHDLDVEVDFQGLDTRLNETQETMIYRIVQELTTNIVKHAAARSILIQIIRKNSHALILVEDDGKGFNWNKAKGNGGLGLKGLESRVEYLNGKIDFDTVEGEGTTVTINIGL